MSLHATRTNHPLMQSLRALLRPRPVPAVLFGVPGLALSGLAMAGPAGEDVIRGSADVTRPDAHRTNITQHTDRAVINWQTFNVDADEFVTFFQPGASSIVLNRVLGGDASHILGHIEANGQIFLLNPNGVFFTHGASLDVQGFLGTTLDMNPDAFMAGDFSLSRSAASPATAHVINDGVINAGPGGYVVLAGDFTENTGVITANAGTVALVSGNALTLDIEGDGLVNFAVSEATLSEAAGVHNAGSLIADGGRVIMTAKVANDLVATAVNNEGLVRAHSVEERNGEIYLIGNGGDVVNSGTLDADGENADGGFIGIRSDRDITLADGGVQTAAGDANHDGGMIRAIAEEHLDYQQDNLIRATGGASGGFVEVSGHGSIMLRGIPEIGAGGTYFIDPSNLNIGLGTTTNSSSISVIDIQNQLNIGTNVILAASNSITATVSSLIATGNGDLTIGIGTESGGTFTPFSGGNINLANMDISVGGDVLIQAGSSGNVTMANIATTGGAITIAGGTINVGALDASGNIELGSTAVNARQITVNGNLDAGGDVKAWVHDISGLGIDINGDITAGSNVFLQATGSSGASASIDVSGSITATAGNIDLFASGASFGGNVNVGVLTANGDITITANGGDDSGGNITTGNILAGSDLMLTANNVTGINGGIIDAGNIDVGGNVTITATGGTGGGRILLSSIDFGGTDLQMQATGGSDGANAAGVIEGAWLTAHGGGNVTMTALHTTGGLDGGRVSFSTIHGANDVNITATGSGSGTNEASVTIGQFGNTSGNVVITTNASLSVRGGNILVGSAGSVSMQGGKFFLSADGGSLEGGNITLGSAYADSLSIDANGQGSGGNIFLGGAGNTISVAGAFSADAYASSVGGNISASGSIAAIGDMNFIAAANGSGGNITIYGNVTAAESLQMYANGSAAYSGGDIIVTGDVAGSSISLSADGGTTYGGDIIVGNATGGDFLAIATGYGAGDGNITVGNLNMTDVVSLIANGGSSSGGNITAGNIKGNTVDLNAFFGSANVSIGNVDARSSISIDATPNGNSNEVVTGNLRAGSETAAGAGRILIDAAGGIETGSIVAINRDGGASLDVQSMNGGITVNGDVRVAGMDGGSGATTRVAMNADGGAFTIDGNLVASGYGGTGDGGDMANAVDINLHANGDIAIGGGVSITGNAHEYSADDASGTYGRVEARIYAETALDIAGPIDVTGTGTTRLELTGVDITTGNISILANPESFTSSYTDTGGYSHTERTVVAGGLAELELAARNSPSGGTITVGDISVTGPDARVYMTDAESYTAGAITMRATGNDMDYSFMASYGNAGVTGSMNGGFAQLLIGDNYYEGTSGLGEVSIDINGAIDVRAHGNASVTLMGDHIATRSVNATATAADFSRTFSGDGTASMFDHYGAWPNDAEFGGPAIDEGTITGGAAHIEIGGVSSYGGGEYAMNVDIDGDLTASAPGQATIHTAGNDIAVSGAIKATATRAMVDGSYTDSDSTDGTFTNGTTQASIGIAGVELDGMKDASHSVTVGGGIVVEGPRARFNASGGDVTLGNLSVVSTGFEMNVDEVTTDSSEVFVSELHFAGSHLVTGVGVEAEGDAVVGDVNIKGPGIAGIIFEGATITTGSISVTATAGEFTVTSPDYNGGAEATVATGAALLAFVSPATATVNGDITINGARTAHYGGAVNASGDFSITGGKGVLDTVPAYVDFLDGIGDDGSDSGDPLVLPAARIRAANITASVTNGDLGVGAAQLATTGALTLNASGAVNFQNRTQDAGSIAITAGGSVNVSGSTLNADTIRLDAGTNLSVSNVNLTADQIALIAGGNISNSNPAGVIKADALAILAGGSVNLANTTLIVGAGSIESVPGDTLFLQLLAAEGIATPEGGPNLVIRAENVALGGGTLNGDYVYLETNSLVVNGAFTTSNPDLLLQVAPHATDASFSLEQSSASGGDAAYVYDGVLAAFNAGTIALGTTAHTGDAGIGANSTVDIGDTNLFVLTQGATRGIERVLSSGVVKDLAMLISGGFDVPQTGEIDPNQDIVQTIHEHYALDGGRGSDDEEEGDEEGEDTDTDADVEEDDDGLIRQDTVDEEMMCS